MQKIEHQTPKPSAKSGLIICLLFLLVGSGCQKLLEEFHEFKDDFTAEKAIDLKLVADNFVSPLGVVEAPDHSRRLFVIDQAGQIWIIDKNGNKLSTPFLDISSKLVPLNPNGDERGLLGLAFHPDYKTNGRFFVYYNAPPRPGGPQPNATWNNLSRIAEFKASSLNPDQADINSEKAILEIDDPQGNHNGGTLAFGPDGYLYIAIGDGGAANDSAAGHIEDWYDVNAGGNGQDVDANLFGDILRIDVNKGEPYSIPPDNPFVGRQGKDEIYAYGFRNPYRMSFDLKGTNQLFVGDAGQVLYEEVSIVRKGGNYGWNVKEGTHCFSSANNMVELPSCPSVDVFGNPLIDPIIEINNWRNPKGGKATTIIGGHVYRGLSISSLYGKYVFGTFSQNFSAPNGELFVAKPANSGLWSVSEISLKSSPDDLGHFLKGFGQNEMGEIYLTVSGVTGPSGNAGKVFKLVEVKK